jgi:hypothetical protein
MSKCRHSVSGFRWFRKPVIIRLYARAIRVIVRFPETSETCNWFLGAEECRAYHARP